MLVIGFVKKYLASAAPLFGIRQSSTSCRVGSASNFGHKQQQAFIRPGNFVGPVTASAQTEDNAPTSACFGAAPHPAREAADIALLSTLRSGPAASFGRSSQKCSGMVLSFGGDSACHPKPSYFVELMCAALPCLMKIVFPHIFASSATHKISFYCLVLPLRIHVYICYTCQLVILC